MRNPARVVSAIAGMILAIPAASAQADEFAYTLHMTPEEGPVDPAIQRRFTPQWKACQNAATPPSGNARCYQAEFARQDASLNRAWAAALHRVPSPRHRALLMAQRRWIAQRDPFCANHVNGMFGSLESVAYLDCRVELTIRRTMWLEHLGRQG